MGEGAVPAWKGCGEKEEENKQGGVRLVVGLQLQVWVYLTGCGGGRRLLLL